jgi:CDGSH-type Zn-finger protein
MTEVIIRSTKDGPNVLLIDGAVKGAFCRCGHSEHKPMCDGTHKKANFQAQEAETKFVV